VIKEGIEEQLMEIDYDGDGKVDREVTPSVTEISTKERARWPLVPGGLIGIALLLIILAVKLYPRREAPVSRERICPKCGEVNRPDAKFCKHCGAKL
jgi:ribosomal protein L40E